MPPTPKRHPHHPPPRPRAPLPASRALEFIDRERIDAALQRFVTDPEDRAFLLRCILDEGPIHHRGANFILIALLDRLGSLQPGRAEPAAAPPAVVVPMRLPPHLADQIPDADYPIRLHTDALSALVQGDPARLEAAIDCLTDGPVQHALANVLMVNLLDRLLAQPAR